eukprot:2999758-Pleurochrysis_carterae.AAC.1
MTAAQVQPGEFVFQQGDIGTEMYILVLGAVSIELHHGPVAGDAADKDLFCTTANFSERAVAVFSTCTAAHVVFGGSGTASQRTSSGHDKGLVTQLALLTDESKSTFFGTFHALLKPT